MTDGRIIQPGPWSRHVDYSSESIAQIFAEARSRRTRLGPLPVPVRDGYWRNVTPHETRGDEAHALVQRYATLIERDMAEICRTHSIAYWLHAYREVPFAVTPPADRPMVAGLLRATVESACHKYGRMALCDGMGWSDAVLPERIFNGRYVRTASIADATVLNRGRRLVFTTFDVEQLEQLWVLEQLGHDLHLCSLLFRLIPHGGWLVHGTNWFNLKLPPDVERDGELYNRRLGRFEASATGTLVDHSQTQGSVLFATYNALNVVDYANQIGDQMTGVRVRFPAPPPFVWFPFPLRNYFDTHRGFENAFRERNGCDLSAIMFVLARSIASRS